LRLDKRGRFSAIRFTWQEKRKAAKGLPGKGVRRVFHMPEKKPGKKQERLELRLTCGV